MSPLVVLIIQCPQLSILEDFEQNYKSGMT